MLSMKCTAHRSVILQVSKIKTYEVHWDFTQGLRHVNYLDNPKYLTEV